MKQNRIDIRASQQEQERFLEAAAYKGMTLSAFLREAALEKSDHILKQRDSLTLSDRDRDLFLEALENPMKPTKYLKQAFKDYHKLKNKANASPLKSQKKK